MDRDAILAELLEIEGMLLDDRLGDEDRHALHGAGASPRAGRGDLASGIADILSRRSPP
jgi:hypothetical protein